MAKVYTVVEISKRLGRPRSTVVDWSRQFEEYLATEGVGRSLRFTERALEVFGVISKLKEEGQTNDHIKRHLSEIVPEIIISMPTNDGNYLMQLAEMYRALHNEQQQTLEEVQQIRQELQEEREQTRQEVQQARQEIQQIEERIEQRMTTQNENVSVILREMREIRQAQIAAAAEQEKVAKKNIKSRLQKAWKAFTDQ